jgi:hypothetical protein
MVGGCALAVATGSFFALSAGRAGASGAVIADGFNRTVSGGWGTPAVGGAWSNGVTGHPATQLAVTPGAGTMVNAPTQGSEVVSEQTAADSDMSATFAVSAIPAAGSGAYFYLEQRLQADGASKYAARVRMLPGGPAVLAINRMNGSAQTLIGKEVSLGTATVGQKWHIEGKVSGTEPVTLSARAWPDGAATPAWQIIQTDSTPQAIPASGRFGLFSYVSGTSTSPVTTTVTSVGADDLNLTPPERPATPAVRAATNAGAAAVGAARYTPPADALYVATTGADTNAGTVAAPFRTVAHAIAVAATGQTIVLRAGEYNESDRIPAGKALTIQNYPGEAAYLDGAAHLNSGWTSTGTTWTLPNWTVGFDNALSDSPTTPASWTFVGAQNPLANDVDQVWIDGAPQKLVASAAAVTPGSFFVDYVNHALVLGTNPAGHDVKASNQINGLFVYGSNSIVRGIGVRDYADSLDQFGALVVSNATGVTIENVVVTNNATYGLVFTNATNGTVRNVTADSNGLLGMGSYHADNLVIDKSRFDGNNTHNFNMAPKSGGYKSDDTRGITITDSQFNSNAGPGMWFDQSTYNVVAARNDIIGNAGHGVSFEISAQLLFVDNRVLNSGGNGLKLNDSSGIALYNNTVAHSGSYAVWAVQDTRVASDLTVPGHDMRQPLPDPTMTWLLGGITATNNVFSGTSSSVLFNLQDGYLHRTADEIGISLNGNVYARTSATTPSTLFAWQQTNAAQTGYSSLAELQAATGQESRGLAYDSEILNPDGTLASPLLAAIEGIVQTPPTNVQALLGPSGPLAAVGF